MMAGMLIGILVNNAILIWTSSTSTSAKACKACRHDLTAREEFRPSS